LPTGRHRARAEGLPRAERCLDRCGRFRPVPYIVRWPAKIKPGTTDHLCYFPDALPTICEIVGISAPADVDGISFLPTLIGADAAGHAQRQHSYLYWEMGQQTAVRMGQWKGVRPRENADWELYDLQADLSESRNVASDNAQIVAKIEAIAVEAHTPVEEGTFQSTELHERDRQAKFGFDQPAAQPNRRRAKGQAAAVKWSTDDLLPAKDWKVVSFSGQARGKPVANAIDGDPFTWWHTEFQPQRIPPPHDLVIDLGQERTIRGFRYLARQDESWSGTAKEAEFSIAVTPEEFREPIAKATLKQVRTPQTVACPPTKGRYIRLRILSAYGDGDHGSASELGLLGE
jgi:hypothetical protein